MSLSWSNELKIALSAFVAFYWRRPTTNCEGKKIISQHIKTKTGPPNAKSDPAHDVSSYDVVIRNVLIGLAQNVVENPKVLWMDEGRGLDTASLNLKPLERGSEFSLVFHWTLSTF